MAYDRSKVRVLKKTSGSKHQALIKEQVIKTSSEEVKKKDKEIGLWKIFYQFYERSNVNVQI